MPPKRPLSRKRQTKLNFSPASNASPKPKPKPTFTADSDSGSDSGPSPSRPAKRQRVEQETRRGTKQGPPLTQSKRGMFGSSDNEIVISSGSSSETSKDYGATKAAASPKKRVKKSKAVVIAGEEEDEVETTHKKGKQRKVPTPHDSSASESVGEAKVVKRHPQRKRNKLAEAADQEDSLSKHKAGRHAKRASTASKDPSDAESQDEDSTIVKKKPTKKKKGRKTLQSKQGGRAPKQDLADLSDEDSEDEVVSASRNRAQKRKARAGSSEEEEVVQEKLLLKGKKRRASTPEEDSSAEDQDTESNDEADELKEDLAFLQASPPGLGKTRTTAKTAREKALEDMKKRRAANAGPSPSPAGRKKPVVVDSDSESDLEIIPEAREDSSEQDDASEEPDEEEDAVTAHEVLYGNGDDDDEDFINDDDAPIGAPSEVALPLMFSKMRNAKPREFFKFAIQWMVQKKINPAFSSKDEIYIMTFMKLDDELKGLASSKYHSSAWTPEFSRAIRARPEMDITEIDPRTRAIMEPHCEACNRKTHTASFEMHFTGKPYHKETLEPLAVNASDSESDSNSDSSEISSTNSEEALNGEKPTYDDRGERIPPESKVFSMGSTCNANAQIAHTLLHWKYNLNAWVKAYLERKGHLTDEKLVARDKWSVRKREKLANKIVDQMEQEGEIQKLHKLYKDQVNHALEANNDYRKGWGRRA